MESRAFMVDSLTLISEIRAKTEDQRRDEATLMRRKGRLRVVAGVGVQLSLATEGLFELVIVLFRWQAVALIRLHLHFLCLVFCFRIMDLLRMHHS
ncbi:hypothetical protein LWI29_002760 [Acer saccharum]|uniref:Uncharacterized protein n=1 Tax=Acer saccharum TaxID=4024 RepID=A0AA39SW32_ACESA|nr:hypothetical protein LWI29_002760 [Acer saccharum]